MDDKSLKAAKGGISMSAAVSTSQPRDNFPAWKRTGMLVMSAVTPFVSGYDVSNLANIQAPVYEAMGHIELLPWVAVAYSIANAAFIPLCRKLCGFCDLKPLLIVFTLIFLAGATICGAAENINTVIIGRIINGIGAAGVYQCNLCYNVVFARPKELPRIQALLGIAWALGLICGPVVGGAFADNIHATWRWAFYFNLPLCGIIIVGTVWILPSFKLPSQESFMNNVVSLDWLGVVLHMASLVLFGAACIFSGPIWDWSSGASVAVWTVTGIVFVAYVLQQAFCVGTTSQKRIFPVHLIRHRTALLTSLGTAGAASSYALTLYFTPIFFAFTRGSSPLAAAVRLLPFVGVFIVFVLLTGGLLPVLRRYAPLYVIGGAFCCIGAGLMTTIGPDTSESHVMGFGTIIGAGIGLLFQTGLGVTSLVLSPQHRFDAAMLHNLSQLGPISITLSIAGTVYQNVGFQYLRDALAGLNFTDVAIREALGGVASLVWKPGSFESSATVHIAVAAVTKVIARLFYMVIAAGLVSFAAGCAMKWEALDFKGRKSVENVEEEYKAEKYESVNESV